VDPAPAHLRTDADADADAAPSHATSAAHTGRLARAAFVAWLGALVVCWVDVHSWESSLYAASAEGFVQLAELFGEPGGHALPDLSLFHPYHPLFHATARALFVALGAPTGAGALTLTVAVNKLAAAVALVLAFRVLRHAGASPAAALVGVVFVAATKAFLFAAFAGEAHVISWAFLLAALERTFVAVARPGATTTPTALRVALLPTLLWCTGAAFNVAVVFYGLVPGAVLVRARRWRELLAAALIGAVALVGVFVVLPVLLFELPDLDAYRRLVALYADLPRAAPPLAERFVDAARAIGAGLVAGIADPPRLAARIVVAVVLGAGAVTALARGLASRWFFAALWAIGFVVGEVLMNTARSVNGTLYVVLALASFVVVAVDHGPRALRGALAGAVVVLFVHNFVAVVVAKCFTGGRYASPLAALAGTPTQAALRDRPVAVYVDHMAVFDDVYALGHDLGVRDVTVFVSKLHRSGDAFGAYLQDKGPAPVCVLSSRPLRLPLDVVVEQRVTLPPEVYHFSVDHPEAQRPVHKVTWLGCRGLPRGRR